MERGIIVLAVLAVVVQVSACGSSGSGPTSNSAASESTASAGASEGTVAAGAGPGDCPLTQAEVDSAFGQEVPQFSPSIERQDFICEFTGASEEEANTDIAARFANPTVEVSVFPLPDGEQKTPAALMARLEELAAEMSPEEREENVGELQAVPAWGDGAFLSVTSHSANSVIPTDYSLAEIWMPHQKITVSVPGSTAELTETAKKIGDAAA